MSEQVKGVITKGVGGVFTVRCNDGSIRLCQIRGNIRLSKLTPLVGDIVLTGESGDPDIPYVLEKILPRRNSLVRPPLANIDNLFLIFSCTDPVPDLKLLDKMLIICGKLKINPVVLFSKRDKDQNICDKYVSIYRDAGLKCYPISKGEPIPSEITALLKEGLTGLAGPSGVGKSTFCNNLLGESTVKVGDISDRLKRGKHTTRHAQLFEYEGGFITDTPGFTSLDLFEVGVLYTDVAGGYPEIIKASSECKFADCRHVAEKQCHVRDLVGDKIDEGRYDRYREFYEYLYSRRPNSAGGYK
ncbi:MAG: ribosome small subunit-dependent GTPase A [Clostridiales bacterium]|nr:ribosome small subunit-dependent GTPase A [Clostridiales bacterium]